MRRLAFFLFCGYLRQKDSYKHYRTADIFFCVKLLVQNKEYDSALEVIDFCESTIEEVIGTNNLDYGLCEFYRGVIAYTRSQPVIAEQHLLNADAVFHAVMNEKPDNDYTKSTARFLYSLYMRWGKPELASNYKQNLLS